MSDYQTTAIAETDTAVATQADAPTMAMFAFDADTMDGKKRVFNALNGASSLNDANADVMTITGLIIRPSQRTDAITGEVVHCTGVTFISADGSSYFSISTGIVNSAVNLMQALGGKFPAGEQIDIAFKSRDLGRGKTLKYFEWI